MSVVSSFLFSMMSVAVITPIAWFVVSRWLFGRPMIIAAAMTATAVVIGRNSYFGPATIDAAEAIAGVLGAILAGSLIGKFWLAREISREGEK